MPVQFRSDFCKQCLAGATVMPHAQALCAPSAHAESPPCPEDSTITQSQVPPHVDSWVPKWTSVLWTGHLYEKCFSLNDVPPPRPTTSNTSFNSTQSGALFFLKCIREFSACDHDSYDSLLDRQMRRQLWRKRRSLSRPQLIKTAPGREPGTSA